MSIDRFRLNDFDVVKLLYQKGKKRKEHHPIVIVKATSAMEAATILCQTPLSPQMPKYAKYGKFLGFSHTSGAKV